MIRKRLKFQKFLIIGVACILYTGQTRGDGGQPEGTSSGPDFASIQTQILNPKCVMCHGAESGNMGGINLETYESVVANISAVQNAISVTRTMPPGSPLSVDLQTLFNTWVSDGAPENTGTTEVSEPQPPLPQPPSPLEPKFSSISKNIFTPKCVYCHGPEGTPPASNMPVTNYNFLLKMLWVVPGNLEQSQIYESVKLGRMPLGGSLTQDEINTIGTWISQGAKNN